MAEPVHIVAAKRTAVGRFGGALADMPATLLGARVLARLLEETSLDPAAVAEAIIGQVLTGGAGQNPARQMAIGGGLPEAVPAFTVNKVCGSGLKAIQLGAQAIAGGDAGIIVAGGQESMSRAPHLLVNRRGTKIGDITMTDSIMIDGLVDAFHHVAMGVTGDRLAAKYGISREDQDRFALTSHGKALTATESGRFADEIVTLTAPGRDPRPVGRDEQPRADSSMAALGKLAPAFGDGGTVTAGNAASLNDGAAAVILASESQLRPHRLTPLARIVSYASAAIDPMEMGMGAGAAAQRALQRAGWTSADLDLIELNEAFAAQALAVIRALDWDEAKVNVNGGAIALGHPIGASGARLVVTLLHEMIRRGAKRGLATLCIGGGQGVAICLERD